MKKIALVLSLFLSVFFLSFVVSSADEFDDEILCTFFENKDSVGRAVYKSECACNYTEIQGTDEEELDSLEGMSLNPGEGINNIIPNDNRTRITNDNLYNQNPYNKVCMIVTTFGNDNVTSYGTGFLVGPKTIMTSCHNLYRQGVGFYNTISVKIAEHYDNSVGNYVNTYQASNITNYEIGNYWYSNNPDDDWAIFNLTGSVSFPYFSTTSETLNNNAVLNTLGYQDGYDHDLGISNGNANNPGTYSFKHTCDTTDYTCGAPIRNTSGKVVGIESDYNITNYNYGSKISIYLIDRIMNRINGAVINNGVPKDEDLYEVDSSENDSEYIVSDEEPMHYSQPYEEISFSNFANSIYYYISLGYNTLMIKYSLDLREIDDGYQEMYVMDYSGNNLVDPILDFDYIEYNIGYNYTNFTFYAEIPLNQLADDISIYLRFGAHGNNTDDWMYKHLSYNIYLSYMDRVYDDLICVNNL